MLYLVKEEAPSLIRGGRYSADGYSVEAGKTYVVIYTVNNFYPILGGEISISVRYTVKSVGASFTTLYDAGGQTISGAPPSGYQPKTKDVYCSSASDTAIFYRGSVTFELLNSGFMANYYLKVNIYGINNGMVDVWTEFS